MYAILVFFKKHLNVGYISSLLWLQKFHLSNVTIICNLVLYFPLVDTRPHTKLDIPTQTGRWDLRIVIFVCLFCYWVINGLFRRGKPRLNISLPFLCQQSGPPSLSPHRPRVGEECSGRRADPTSAAPRFGLLSRLWAAWHATWRVGKEEGFLVGMVCKSPL